MMERNPQKKAIQGIKSKGTKMKAKEVYETELQQAYKELEDLRYGEKAYADELRAKRQEFEDSIADLKQKCKEAGECVDNQAEKVREKMIGYFSEHQIKKADCGVGIRETTKLVYDKDSALKWAMEKQLALNLDVRAFEKIAKSTPLDFVKEEKTVTATIPRSEAR